jgi:hypothetical protein
MGFICHNAIVVTADSDAIKAIHAEAVRLCGDLVSNVVKARINFEASFFVAPDGSKEGWGDSQIGDKGRAALREYLKTCKGGPDWVEVAYSPDAEHVNIVDSSYGGAT